MPEYKSPKKDNQPVKQTPPKPRKAGRGEVVSAYSEEGKSRGRTDAPLSLRFKVLLFAMFILCSAALILFLLWRLGVFG